jgi:hypothetical protein
MKKLGIILALAAVCSSTLNAQEVRIDGLSSALLDGQCRKDNQVRGSKDEQLLVEKIAEAKVNALRTYASTSSISVASAFTNKEADILLAIDEFLLNQQIRIRCDEKSKDLMVQITAVLNKSAWDRTLALESIQATDRSRMTAMFVARKVGSVTNFDAKRSVLSQEEFSSETVQGADVSSGSSIEAFGDSTSTTVTTTGGRTEQKAEVREYILFANDDLDAAINQGISTLGYRVAPIAQINGMPIEDFRTDFASGEIIKPETLNEAFRVLSGLPAEVMFMVATLDVGTAQLTDNSNWAVTVSINAQVFKSDGLFFEVVASVGPKQMNGQGRDSIEAERVALTLSASETVKELGAQLQAKNIY